MKLLTFAVPCYNSEAYMDHCVQTLLEGGEDVEIILIDDGDAINYAAQFYASIANGQSVRSAHLSGQAALEMAGLDGAELPTLAAAADVDPGAAILVKPAD